MNHVQLVLANLQMTVWLAAPQILQSSKQGHSVPPYLAVLSALQELNSLHHLRDAVLAQDSFIQHRLVLLLVLRVLIQLQTDLSKSAFLAHQEQLPVQMTCLLSHALLDWTYKPSMVPMQFAFQTVLKDSLLIQESALLVKLDASSALQPLSALFQLLNMLLIQQLQMLLFN